MYHETSGIIAFKTTIIITAIIKKTEARFCPLYYSHVGYMRKEEGNMENRTL